MTQQKDKLQQANQRLVKRMVVVGVVMFGFSFALVPLYNVFCDAFGLNGRFVDIEKGQYDAAQQAAAAKTQVIDKSRLITIQFVASRNQNLPWEFRPLQATMQVHPGEVKNVSYYARNMTDKTVVAQAVPSLSPGQAVKYFSKIECFCFKQQTFEPGESREMPLQFVVDADLPREINTITIAYTFFDSNKGQASLSVETSKRKS
ncbi:MAG: cytochrome c oxidase assembly protein [Gammaproteobacteria bacterium]